MSLTSEEKEACADLYFTFTGGDNSMPAHSGMMQQLLNYIK